MTVKNRYYIRSTRSNRSERFDKRLILQVVNQLEHGLPRKEACALYGVAYSTINEWVKRLASENYRSSSRRSFSVHQKRKIVRLLREQKITGRQARELYKLTSNTLNSWLREFEQEEEGDLAGSNQSQAMKNQTNSSEIDLHKELSQAKLKIKALETMIDIAEEQFKISIRKKSGAKQ